MGATDRLISWQEVQEHNTPKDSWMVIDGRVYATSKWSFKHPGGKVLHNYAGEDATDAFRAFHPEMDYARKFMKPLEIGVLDESTAPKTPPMLEDFRKLRLQLEKEGYFRANYWFYIWNFAHIVALEGLSVWILYMFGTGWLPYILAGISIATAQAQAGWLQHDFGHLSVFKGFKRGSVYDHFVHHIVIGTFKGASSNWWNWRHYNHHAKPNILNKDYDIAFPYIFVLGEEATKKWAKSKRGFLPYRLQHRYWFMTMPPLLLPVYFHMENLHYCIKKNHWRDLISLGSYYARFFLLFSPVLGMEATWKFYFFFRFIESHWFVWITQMSHIPMKVEADHQRDWFTLQNQATCDVEGGRFNDWFSGHLNYQIEHHLFPTMPRHHYRAVQPMIKDVYERHGVEMQIKTMTGAFSDILRVLEKYGNIYHDSYFSK